MRWDCTSGFAVYGFVPAFLCLFSVPGFLCPVSGQGLEGDFLWWSRFWECFSGLPFWFRRDEVGWARFTSAIRALGERVLISEPTQVAELM